MNQNGVVLLTTILKFKRISQTLNSTSPSAHLDILKQVIKKSEMCELMDEGVRLKTGWEYWLVNVTKKVIV